MLGSCLTEILTLLLQGAIFASIGLTALQLPNMNAVHWSARACCSSSMVLGVVSVVTAARQHQLLGMLNSPLDIRMWLSRGRPTSYRSLLKVEAIILRHYFNTGGGQINDKYEGVVGFQGLPLESSISALKAIALPRHLLDLAVLVFIVGFGLYVLFLWLYNVEESGGSYRNVFIIFILTVGVYAIYDLFIKLARILDNDKRDAEFKTKALGGFREPEALLVLQKELKEVQRRIREHTSPQELRMPPLQRQQDLENGAEVENPTFVTTNPQLLTTDDHNITSPPQVPSTISGTATLPRITRGHSTPGSSTNPSASPDCKVDKYQAWQHYLIGYMKTQAVSKNHSLLLKIMELKGGFEAEWDTAIAVDTQDTLADDPE